MRLESECSDRACKLPLSVRQVGRRSESRTWTVTARKSPPACGSPAVVDHGQAYDEIQEAAAASLAAMRRMVGMLRADEDALPDPPAGIRAALADLARSDPRVTIEVTDAAAELAPGPDVLATLHWIMLEALTNVRRHAGGARTIEVSARLDGTDKLVLDIANDGVTATDHGDAAPHYGLVGMRERLAALGGTLDAGPQRDGRWRVTARVPLGAK